MVWRGDAPDELSPDWDEDAIYCEAIYQPQDVLYQGSEDEDYTSPTARRLKYKAAGQRYLDGKTPFLLSASLRGPFDRESGWENPWRSKKHAALSRTRQQDPCSATSQVKGSVQTKRLNHSPVVPDSFECHLPSPESLKQDAITEPHTYLADDEVAAVQNWRSSVQENASQDAFWASHPAIPASEKKRKAKGSGWLMKPAIKRTKIDIMESGVVDTPVHKRTRHTRLPLSKKGAGPARLASFRSAPEQPTPAARSSQRQVPSFPTGSCGKDAEDELIDDAFVSFSSAPTRVSSPPKRVSPRRSMWKPSAGKLDSEDELSQEKAAATLSSPVSQKDEKTRPAPKQPPRKLSRSQSSNQATVRSSGIQDDVSMAGSDKTGTDDSSDALETQEDESFCYRKRTKTASHGAQSVEDQGQAPKSSSMSSTASDSGSGSELSELSEEELNALEVAKNMSPESAEPTHQAQAATGRPNIRSPKIIANTLVGGITPRTGDGWDEVMPDAEPLPTVEAKHCTLSVKLEDDLPMRMAETPRLRISVEQQQEEGSSIHVSLDDKSELATPIGDMGAQRPAELQARPEGETVVDTNSTPTDGSNEDLGCESGEKDSSHTTSTGGGMPSTPRVEDEGADAQLSASATRVSNSFTFRGMFKRLVPSTSWVTSSFTGTPTTSQASLALSEAGNETEENISNGTQADENDEAGDSGALVCSSTSSDVENAKMSAAVTPLPVSQQSPWADSKSSQYAAEGESHVVAVGSLSIATPQRAQEGSVMASSETQSPWTSTSNNIAATPSQLSSTLGAGEPVSSSAIPAFGIPQYGGCGPEFCTPLVPMRRSTPEPQFTVKSFASFMSPSPQRRRTSFRPRKTLSPHSISARGILSSGVKGQQSARSSRRVSWAPLPGDVGDEDEAVEEAREFPPSERIQPGSPPPTTSIIDLPTSEGSKFHSHFTAVASRTGVLGKQPRARILPTASQESTYSPKPQAMAEKFLAADEMRVAPEFTDSFNVREEVDEAQTSDVEEPRETQDLVHEVFEDMADFLEGFNIDAELDQAKKGAISPALGPAASMTQSPW